MKQFQNKKETPRQNNLAARFSFYCTTAQKRKLMRKGGAAFLRKLIKEA